ncbi:sulfite exporter TauE/SafE family protein [Vitreimonas sp.]|uniref:sulfite exporter TauE/SafE family protein n=1 Tax=Vitreimonas sp. TaxID=3069702 RepID=UPI002EDA9E56
MGESMILYLALAIASAAALYSSVGHGGASAYIALMALAGLAPDDVRPAALVLNIVVAGLGAFRFIRAGRFDWRVFWPFAIAAIPTAFLAGRIDMPEHIYRPLLAFALAAAALRYLVWPQIDAIKPSAPPSPRVALPAGAALGALAGLTGIGGGVYLSPLLVFAGWADPQRATGIAACFIVVNSLAGLAGRASSLASLPNFLPWLVAAAIIGALIGTTWSLKGLNHAGVLRVLGLVLGIAAAAIIA